MSQENGHNEAIEWVALVSKAGYLLSSMRDIGYSFETAVADLVDNSISASARSIWIDAEWNNGQRFVAISDDCKGLMRMCMLDGVVVSDNCKSN